jgi:hypothetical protein
VNSEQSTVNSQLEFTIPMLTDLILVAYAVEAWGGLLGLAKRHLKGKSSPVQTSLPGSENQHRS